MTLLLDLDNTLVDRDAAVLAWLRTLVPEADVARLFAADRGGYGPKPALFAAVSAASGRSPGAIKRSFTHDFPTFSRLRPDADALLRAWAGATVLVTNGPSELQRGKIAAAGLEGRLTAVVVSGEVGADKPAAAIFHHALAVAGVAPHEAHMVGDHPDNDIAGARNVGIPATFVRSRWFAAPAGVAAITDLTELLPDRAAEPRR